MEQVLSERRDERVSFERLASLLAGHRVARSIGLELAEWESGRVACRLVSGTGHSNPATTAIAGHAMNGGVIAAILESAGRLAIGSVNGADVSTLSLTVDFLAPARGDGLSAEGVALRVGRRFAWADARIADGDGRTVAVARLTAACRS